MSHFVGLCFGKYWDGYLEQYNENNIEVYKYTKEEAIDIAKKEHASNYEMALNCLRNKNLNPSDVEYFEKVIEKGLFLYYDDAWKEVQNWGYEIDENENVIISNNPNAKWDWYSIGGRWSGFLKTKNGENVNQDICKNIDWDYMFNNRIPLCYLDSEGEWHEKASVGWFGCTTDICDEKTWLDQLKDYIDNEDMHCQVTVVDFHI